tara:strand:+ start:115 stop:597 length:483 start_codon:yes stop_codon:yes gene_type:complete
MTFTREKKLNFQKFYLGSRNRVSSSNELTTDQVIESIQLDGYIRFTDIKKNLHYALFDFGFTNNVKVNSKFRYSLTGVKNNYGVCVQLGNIGNFAFDILKVKEGFENRIIEQISFIIPMDGLVKKMNSGNCANYERIFEQKSFFSNFIDIPCVIYGIDIL